MKNLIFNRTRKIKNRHRIFQEHTEQLPLIFYAVWSIPLDLNKNSLFCQPFKYKVYIVSCRQMHFLLNTCNGNYTLSSFFYIFCTSIQPQKQINNNKKENTNRSLMSAVMLAWIISFRNKVSNQISYYNGNTTLKLGRKRKALRTERTTYK